MVLAKLLKKIRRNALIVALGAAGFTASIIFPTLTWFDSDTTSSINIKGNVHGSYFESGDGSAEDPFEIARPIQLYYLSWLQEMGYFNEAEEQDGAYTLKRQYHFYLSKDLDMNTADYTYILPPIGTVKYPFIGSFDGKGHVITDLQIKNDVSEYTDDPRSNSKNGGTSSDSYEILGMFGVLGTTEDTNVVNCSTINDAGVVSQVEGTTVSFDIGNNFVTNLYLENTSIEASTDSEHALVGVVAGYSNATISNIGINNASMSFANGLTALNDITGTTNFSQYSSVGFVTNSYKRDVDLVNGKIYNPEATAKTYVSNSSGTAWGGSIDMNNMLQRIWKSQYMTGSLNNTVPEYPKKETLVYDNGELISKDITYDNRAFNYLDGSINSNQSYYSSDKTAGADATYSAKESSDNVTIGSYYYINKGSTSKTGDHKAYVGGYSDVEEGCAKKVYTFNYLGEEETCYYVRNSSDTSGNYIGINTSGAITYSSSTANAVKWHLKNKALYTHVKTTDNSTGYTGNKNDLQETIYYLNYDGSSFTLGATSTTEWTYANNQLSVSYSKNLYTIKHNNNSYYLSNNNTSIANQTSAANATKWDFSSAPANNASVTISTTINGTKYYLSRSGTTTLSMSTTSTSWTMASTGTNYYLRSGGNYYIRYYNGWVTTNNTQTGRRALTIAVGATESSSYNFSTTLTTEKAFSMSAGEVQRSGQAGYIPLSVEGDSKATSPFTYDTGKIDISNFYTSSTNTGYVVGGYYDRYNGQNTTTLDKTYYGDVRVAQYANSKIAGSYTWTSGDFSTLYTINDDSYTNGDTQSAPIQFNKDGIINNTSTSLNFKKLSAAVTNLGNTLQTAYNNRANNGNNYYVSGIHFMNSSIGMDKLIKADKAMINGEYKENYEMPEDSIDFKLKDKGYINFFAGNYHNDNNSFFALHHIERDENDHILSMKKIKYVFKNVDDSLGDYIYLYDDEVKNGTNYTWSDGVSLSSRPANKNGFTKNGEHYEFAFDTRWIGVNSTLVPKQGNRIYYFEIPVNEGEYALGSCEGGCGGYLIYLDISAAAQTIQRTTVNEMWDIDTVSGEVPYGTQYIGSIPTSVSVMTTDEQGNPIEDKTAIVRNDISNINDLDSYYSTISDTASGTYSINRNGNNIVTTGDSSMSSTYLGNGLTLNGSSLNNSTRKKYRRITDYDYNTISHQYVRQITTIETIGSGVTAHNYATTSIEYNSTSFTDSYYLVARFSYDWIGDGPNFTYNYYLHASSSGANNGVEILFNNVTTEDWYLTINYLASDFTLSCGANATIINGNDVQTAISNGTELPTLLIPTTTEVGAVDSWYTFTNSTIIQNYNYIRQADEVVTYNFIFSGYECLQILDPFPENEQSITISNGSYTYEFNLSGSSPQSIEGDSNTWFHIYYSGNSTYIVKMADGSEYIAFVNQNS